ncbi:MAG: gliding motility lipoprotein GldH [Cyclobacteriaceae bacterium]|nr:gliding motility lipoprotein GldH [Cyclobacteriaceae bacterium]
MFKDHFLGLILIVLFLGISCNEDRVFEKNVKIKDRIWSIQQPATFQFSIQDTHYPYDFYFNLRNSILYPYQNIYLNYSLMDTLGNIFKSDLVNIRLFDSKTGEPLGDGMGDIFDHQYQVIDNYRFNNPGVYRMRINHYMRPDSLPEIMSVGLRIESDEE